MKTLTEFPATHLKNAARIHKDLTTSGKTPEEVIQGFTDALKLEGDRLQILLNALEVVGPRETDLKRVVVYTRAQEGEKVPTGATQKGDHFYLAEYYPSLEKKAPPRHGKGDIQGAGKGKRKRKPRGDRDARPPRGPAQARPQTAQVAQPGQPVIKRVIAPLATPIAHSTAAPATAEQKKSE